MVSDKRMFVYFFAETVFCAVWLHLFALFLDLLLSLAILRVLPSIIILVGIRGISAPLISDTPGRCAPSDSFNLHMGGHGNCKIKHKTNSELIMY